MIKASETRPDWNDDSLVSPVGPDDSRNDLLLVTRETLSISLSALKQDAAEDYYHNVGAAIGELKLVLAARPNVDAIIAGAESISHQIGEGDLPEPVKTYLRGALAKYGAPND